MLSNKDTVMLSRFGEQKWINKIIEGELSFSCAGAYINQAKHTGNTVQGDQYEGVFAKLRNDDKKIQEMQELLKNDLEVFVEGEYTFLRRKSAKLQPIFCLYSYKAEDIILESQNPTIGMNKVRHDFDDRVYSGFVSTKKAANVVSEDSRFTHLILQPAPFIDRVTKALNRNKIKYRINYVDYELMKSDTFFIEPTEEYSELFYKKAQYSYQYEARICILNRRFLNIFERFQLKIGPLENNEYDKIFNESYFVLQAEFDKKS